MDLNRMAGFLLLVFSMDQLSGVQILWQSQAANWLIGSGAGAHALAGCPERFHLAFRFHERNLTRDTCLCAVCSLGKGVRFSEML